MSEQRAPDTLTVPAPVSYKERMGFGTEGPTVRAPMSVKEQRGVVGPGDQNVLDPFMDHRDPSSRQLLSDALRGKGMSREAALRVEAADQRHRHPDRVGVTGTAPLPDLPSQLDALDEATRVVTVEPVRDPTVPMPGKFYKRRANRIKTGIGKIRSRLWSPVTFPPEGYVAPVVHEQPNATPVPQIEVASVVSPDRAAAKGVTSPGREPIMDAPTEPLGVLSKDKLTELDKQRIRSRRRERWVRRARNARDIAVAASLVSITGVAAAKGIGGMADSREAHVQAAKERVAATAEPFKYDSERPIAAISDAEQARLLGGELDPTLVEQSREQNSVVRSLVEQCVAPFQTDLTAVNNDNLAAKMFGNMTHTQGRNVDTGATWHDGSVRFGDHYYGVNVVIGEDHQLQNASLTQGELTDTGAVIQPFEVTIMPVGVGTNVEGYNVSVQASDPADLARTGFTEPSFTTAPTRTFGGHVATAEDVAALAAFVTNHCGTIAGERPPQGDAELHSGSMDVATAILPGGKIGS